MPRPGFGKQPSNTPALRQSRAKAALLGLAVGELLGSGATGRRGQVAAFPALCDGPVKDFSPSARFGPVTEMAGALALSLRSLRRFDAGDVGRKYLACAAKTPSGVSEVTPAIRWRQGAAASASAGALGRSAAAGVFFFQKSQRENRLAAAMEDCALTHWDATCRLSSAAFSAAIASALESSNPPDMLEAAQEELAVAAAWLGRRHSDFLSQASQTAHILQRDLECARKDDPLLYGPELYLYQNNWGARMAFRLSFWELLHAPNFCAGLIDAVNRGGEASVHGAITGALLGAAHGLSALPARWTTPAMQLKTGSEPNPAKQLLAVADAIT